MKDRAKRAALGNGDLKVCGLSFKRFLLPSFPRPECRVAIARFAPHLSIGWCHHLPKTFFRCAGLPRLAAEGLLLFCLIKKVTKKSRLGTDVG